MAAKYPAAGASRAHHPALLRSRAAFAAFPRKSAISTGPSENSPALAFAVNTRRYPSRRGGDLAGGYSRAADEQVADHRILDASTPSVWSQWLAFVERLYELGWIKGRIRIADSIATEEIVITISVARP